jgi:cold shock CspA family protein
MLNYKMSKQNDATPEGDISSRQLGIVKWFNNKAGFGFVTSLEDSATDIFVHHTGVSVDREQYKYLVQGEYVEFDLSKSDSKDHEWQAVNIKGIKGGALMCETRFLNRQEREQHEESEGRRGNHGGNRGNHGDNRGNHGGNRGGNRGERPRGGGPRDNTRRDAQRWVLDDKNTSQSEQ